MVQINLKYYLLRGCTLALPLQLSKYDTCPLHLHRKAYNEVPWSSSLLLFLSRTNSATPPQPATLVPGRRFNWHAGNTRLCLPSCTPCCVWPSNRTGPSPHCGRLNWGSQRNELLAVSKTSCDQCAHTTTKSTRGTASTMVTVLEHHRAHPIPDASHAWTGTLRDCHRTRV
jgi:hypothetical protein